MSIEKTIDYMKEFFMTRHSLYREMMQDVGPAKRDEDYKGQYEIIQSIHDVVLCMENQFVDVSVPGGFATPALLVRSLEGFERVAAANAVRILEINKATGSHWIDEIEYAHKMNAEVSEAIQYALSLSTTAPEPDALVRVRQMLERLPTVSRKLLERRREKDTPRQTLKIEDEYDVQDLLRSVLHFDFDDVRSEEWTPSFAGSSKRADFLLHKEAIAIEVKKTRPALMQREVADQLVIDIANYRTHPKARHLVCAVWDTDRFIANPSALKTDIEGANDGFVTVVVMQ